MGFTRAIYSITVAIENLLIKRSIGASEYIFTTDFVSQVIPVWERHLAEFKGKVNVSLLEIGSFEGRSTIWFLENILTHPTSSITCVDPFFRAEIRFDRNIHASGHSHKVKKIKGRSENVLRTLRESSFDIVYIDGSHRALNVLMDAVSSWLLLKLGGIIIFDDYGWKAERAPEDGPKTAIDIFLKAFQPHIEILDKNYQVIIRRTR
jgi:predicted O-methyltransferase YrrM